MDCNKTWLKQGSTGDDVKTAETKLKSLGYYTGAVEGNYGQYMAQAVEHYQKDQNLSIDGIIGPKTCNKLGLNSTSSGCPNNQLKQGCTGDNVTDWEESLQSTGCYLGKIDGSFGSVMTDAVKEFQRRQGITEDGLIGDQTINARNTCRSSDDLAVLTYIRNKFGACNSKEELYTLVGVHGHYSFYDDFKYYSQSLSKLFTTGVNCCEACNYVGAPALRAMGYKPSIYLVWIVCTNGKTYGHYFIGVDGITPTTGTNCKAYDLAGVAELGLARRPMGTPICLGKVTIREIVGSCISDSLKMGNKPLKTC